MNRRRPWWPLLVLYTVVLWAATLGTAAVMAALPDNWTYTGDTLPPLMALQGALYTIGPALATSAFALLAITVAIGLRRTGGVPAVPEDDPGVRLDDAVLIDRGP